MVCDLSGVLEDGEPAAVEVLATAGRHVANWSAIPVAVACPDPQIRAALSAHQMGGQLVVTTSVFCALSMVLSAPPVVVESLRLAPHPTATRASSGFLTRTLLHWGLGLSIPGANLVLGELVASSVRHATTDIEVSIAWDQRFLRLSVRDNSPVVPRLPYTHSHLDDTRPTAVAGLSRAFGVLPTADGGKVIWAFLNAAAPRPATRRRPEPAITAQELPAFHRRPRPCRTNTFRRRQPVTELTTVNGGPSNS